jgi:hypothetical protein
MNFITGVNNTSDKLFTSVNNIGNKFIASVKDTTPTINPCHGFSVIASVVDTGDKFIGGDNNTGKQLSPVTTTLSIY